MSSLANFIKEVLCFIYFSCTFISLSTICILTKFDIFYITIISILYCVYILNKDLELILIDVVTT